MNKAQLLLVVSESSNVTNEARATRRALYQAAADKIGAELLVTAEGCHAQLLEVPRPVPEPLVEPAQTGVPVMRYSVKTTEALRVVESLLNQDMVKLVRDRWSQGALRFLPPTSTQPSALTPLGLNTRRDRFAPLVLGVFIGASLSGLFGYGLQLAGL